MYPVLCHVWERFCIQSEADNLTHKQWPRSQAFFEVVSLACICRSHFNLMLLALAAWQNVICFLFLRFCSSNHNYWSNHKYFYSNQNYFLLVVFDRIKIIFLILLVIFDRITIIFYWSPDLNRITIICMHTTCIKHEIFILLSFEK